MSNLSGLKQKRVFVSGASGVIGKKLVMLLHSYGAVILACDKKLRPEEWPPEVQYRSGDLNFLQKYEVDNFQPEIFIHLAAAFERSEETSGFWDEGFEHNVRLSHHLLDIMRRVSSLNRIVFASSYLIYDQSLYMSDVLRDGTINGLNEAGPLNPRNLTGAAKLLHESELLFTQRHSNSGVSAVSARIFRGYGPGSRDVISRWVRAGLSGEQIDVYRPEGIFDYIYASDTAEGLARLSVSDFSGVINLGTGKPSQIRDVLGCLKTVLPDLDIRYSESIEQFEQSYADTSLLRTVLDWVPEITLEEAIPEIVEYETNDKVGSTPIKVLISSASSKVPLVTSFVQVSKIFESNSIVYAGDADANCLSSFTSTNFWNMPRTEENNFDQILFWLKKEKIQLLIPTRDGELEFYANHLEDFSKYGISVLGSSIATINVCLDKLLFYKKLKNLYSVIPTCITLDKEILGHGPYVIKERYGSGSVSLVLNASETRAIAHAATLTSPIFQPYVQGDEYSIDAYVRKNGIFHGLVVRERVMVMNGESQVTRTIFDDQISELTRKIAEGLELRGHFVLQLIKNEQGLHLIECNPRLGGASTLSFAAGLNTPLWSMLEALGIDLASYPFMPITNSIELIRTPVDSIFDTRS